MRGDRQTDRQTDKNTHKSCDSTISSGDPTADQKKSRRTTPGDPDIRHWINIEQEFKALSSFLDSVINTVEHFLLRHRGPLLSGEHLRELGTDRWVDWAIGWSRRITRLLVEADPAGPSTEFVHFESHVRAQSGENSQIGEYNNRTYDFRGKPNCTLSGRLGSCCRH